MIKILALFALVQLGNALFNGGGGILPPVPTVLPPLPVSVPSLPALPIDICAIFKTKAPDKLGGAQIKGVCDMATNWQSGLKDAIMNPRSYRNILTPNQKKYWDRVVGCEHMQCLCDYWPICSAQGIKDINKAENVTAKQRYGQTVRKDIRAMTPVERRRFFYAMNKLKYDFIDGWSKYDILTGYHAFIPFVPSAHFSAGVLPFHRELLKNFEIALRMEHPLASFALWDSSLDAEMPNSRDSVMWTDELMGGGGGNGSDNVTNGPFGTYKTQANSAFPAPINQVGISRAVGLSASGALMRQEYIDIIMMFDKMTELVFCYNPFFDTAHAAVHIYVGGLMADPTSSPGDPLFYLHHAFIDSIWERWRQKHQTREQRESDIALPCPYNPFDLPSVQVAPFNPTIKDCYSNKYTDEFYVYQDVPTCANNCQNSTMLVCKPSNGRCMSKVRIGGDCSGEAASLDACYKGKCQSGKCVAA